MLEHLVPSFKVLHSARMSVIPLSLIPRGWEANQVAHHRPCLGLKQMLTMRCILAVLTMRAENPLCLLRHMAVMRLVVESGVD